MDKHMKNLGYGIASLIIVRAAFGFSNIVADEKFYLITLLLLLIYFELWDKK